VFFKEEGKKGKDDEINPSKKKKDKVLSYMRPNLKGGHRS